MKEIDSARRKGKAFPHCAAAKPHGFIEWRKKFGFLIAIHRFRRYTRLACAWADGPGFQLQH
jgi:hypothetical protein